MQMRSAGRSTLLRDGIRFHGDIFLVYEARKKKLISASYRSYSERPPRPGRGREKKRQFNKRPRLLFEDLRINPYIHIEVFSPWIILGTISFSALTLPAVAFPGRTARGNILSHVSVALAEVVLRFVVVRRPRRVSHGGSALAVPRCHPGRTPTLSQLVVQLQRFLIGRHGRG